MKEKLEDVEVDRTGVDKPRKSGEDDPKTVRRDPVISDATLLEQIAKTVKRVKQGLRYRGSNDTGDFFAGLVLKWIRSGEYERLRGLPPEARHIYSSVRGFVVDRIRGRDREKKVPLGDIQVPDDDVLLDLIKQEALNLWLTSELEKLVRGEVDTRIRGQLTNPRQSGLALQLQRQGQVMRQIAETLGISDGCVHARVKEGTEYLSKLARKEGF
jgi:DNA-directed RNA polymerase specialized sigma24 family protein